MDPIPSNNVNVQDLVNNAKYVQKLQSKSLERRKIQY